MFVLALAVFRAIAFLRLLWVFATNPDMTLGQIAQAYPVSFWFVLTLTLFWWMLSNVHKHNERERGPRYY